MRLNSSKTGPLVGMSMVEDLGDDAGPAVDEVDPAVLDGQVLRLLLGPRLVEEEEVAAVVVLPDEAVLGKADGVGERRAGGVLAEAGGVHDQGAGQEGIHHEVVLLGGLGEDVLHAEAGVDALVHLAHVLEPLGAAVGDHNPGGPLLPPASAS